MPQTNDFTPQQTADGSFTFFSSEFSEYFHSTQGAKEEALVKFTQPCQIAEKAQQPVIRLLDVCYGLGYNTAAALEVIWSTNPHCRVELMALELDLSVPKTAIAHDLLNSWSPPIPQLLKDLATSWGTSQMCKNLGSGSILLPEIRASGQDAHTTNLQKWDAPTSCAIQTDRIEAQLLLGDARTTIQQVYQSGFQADAIFLDPFSPRRCPQLWTVEFFEQLALCSSPTVKLATYSCAALVRSGLMAAGFKIGQTPPLGGRQPGTVASFEPSDLPALPLRSLEHLQTRAAIPLRDPQLCDRASVIVQRRQTEQQQSSLEPTSHWQKRWSASDHS